MKRVKCYGKAKFTTVDSSFKKKFFESSNFKNSFGNNSLQESEKDGINSLDDSTTTTSDFTNIHSHYLFKSDTDSIDESFPTFSPCSSSNVKRKSKSVKHFVANKTCQRKKFSKSSTSDLHTIFTSKTNKRTKKHTRIPKSCAKQKISKQFKSSSELSVSYSDLGLSYTKVGSKNKRNLQSYKKGSLKKKHKTRRCLNLKKHVSIPIQPSSRDFCKNTSTTRNASVKKKKGKNQLIGKPQVVNASNSSDIVPFDYKSDSFWAANQPRWSSIYEYSFEFEKKGERSYPVFFEHENATFNELLSSKGSISRFERSNDPLEVEKFKSTDEIHYAESDSFSKRVGDLNLNSSKSAGSKLKSAKDISGKGSICKKAPTICESMVNNQNLPEIDKVKTQHIRDNMPLTSCKTLSKKLSINEFDAIKGDENTSKCKATETYEKGIRSKKNNEDFIRQSNFITGKAVSGNKCILKENVYCLKNVDQLHEFTPAMPAKKTYDIYSSTPLASPSSNKSLVKFCPSTKAFSPVFKKGGQITCTPIISSKRASSQQNQRSSYLDRPCSSLQDLSIDSFVQLQKCQSNKISSSVLSRGKNRTSTIPFINSSSHICQNKPYSSSRSVICRSERQENIGDSHCYANNCSLSNKELYSSVASACSASDSNSTLSNLLEICGQTKIIPFKELYDWSHTALRKIGEGTYGEVYTIIQNRISSVVKVIPFSEDGKDQSIQSVGSVLSEVTVSQCLSELRSNKNFKTRNFNKLKSVHLVQGCYPDQMLVAWDKFSVAKTTYNLRPDVFNDQQMFVIIELEYGGKDMTCFVLRNAAEAESVLKQIAISLAIAEEVIEFEHRDLHLGNILVQRNASKTISYVIRGKPYSIPNHGLVVTMIDFTLSRVSYNGCVFYNNLADDVSLFNQTGDYQFKVYKDTKVLLNNKWDECLLYSNVLWLTFLCVKLLEYKYSRPSSQIHKKSLNNIKAFQNILGTCKTAYECLSACNILTSVPKSERSSLQKMAMKVKLVDRSSSRISRISNVA